MNTVEKSVCDSSELMTVCTWKSNEKSTLWTRTKVPTLKYRDNVRQACPVHCKGVIRFDSCESFGPIRSRHKERVTVESIQADGTRTKFVYLRG